MAALVVRAAHLAYQAQVAEPLGERAGLLATGGAPTLPAGPRAVDAAGVIPVAAERLEHHRIGRRVVVDAHHLCREVVDLQHVPLLRAVSLHAEILHLGGAILGGAVETARGVVVGPELHGLVAGRVDAVEDAGPAPPEVRAVALRGGGRDHRGHAGPPELGVHRVGIGHAIEERHRQDVVLGAGVRGAEGDARAAHLPDGVLLAAVGHGEAPLAALPIEAKRARQVQRVLLLSHGEALEGKRHRPLARGERAFARRRAGQEGLLQAPVPENHLPEGRGAPPLPRPFDAPCLVVEGDDREPLAGRPKAHPQPTVLHHRLCGHRPAQERREAPHQ